MTKTKIIALAILFTALQIVAVYAPTFPNRKLSPSIKEGVYWKYHQVVNEAESNVIVTVVKVLGESTVKLQVGDTYDVTIDVTDVASPTGEHMIIAQNLVVGDQVLEVAGEVYAVDGIVTREVLGRNRELCVVNVISDSWLDMSYYWDRETGILVLGEYSGPVGTESIELIATNMAWDSVDGECPSFELIILVVLALLVVVFLLNTRKESWREK